MEKKMEYPFEIASNIVKTKEGFYKTLSLEAHFTRQTDDKPLKIFDDTFSRFKMTVISDKNAAICNIPVDLEPLIRRNTDYAYNKHLERAYTNITPVGGEDTSPAFTERFVSGTLKGKTPAQVLVENGEKGKAMLKSQWEWLKGNLEKYPKNKVLMDAIMDVSKLDLETLKDKVNTSNVSSNTINILTIGVRPLVRKQREDKKCLCYEANITWDVTRSYPVNIKLTNYYAPVIKKDDGTLNVQVSDKDSDSEIINEFNTTAEVWLNIVDEMKTKKDAFQMINFKNALTLAENADRKNREGAEKN